MTCTKDRLHLIDGIDITGIITEWWANNDVADGELGLAGYMFWKDRAGRMGGVSIHSRPYVLHNRE